MEKAFTGALFFDVPNLANSPILSQNQSNSRCPFWDMFKACPYYTYFIIGVRGYLTYFGVGSVLLVLDRMAMLEPRYVGRVTERLPRFLYIHLYNLRVFHKG